MGTKGPSNLYGNTKGAPSKHVNFPYAKNFRIETLKKHFDDHAKGLGISNSREYVQKALNFANTINLFTQMYVNKFGYTKRVNFDTLEIVSIDPSGTVRTYFKAKTKRYLEKMIKEER